MTTVPVTGDIISGKYRVERTLGTGGMGTVFEAVHQVTGKRFAVKWLLPDLSSHGDAVQRFIREAQVAGRFEHPNVVEVYDVGQERGSFFMVMELLHGEPLAARLRSRGRLNADEAVGLIIPCLRGVHRAHQAGIVHRDLKPDNIYVCTATNETPETPKVLDFGISKVAARAGEVHASITRTGLVMGTPHYMSPEQLRGKEMDHRVDIYAFGVIMYELLSGKLPFPGDTYGELAVKIATETPIPLLKENPSLPPGLVAVVNKAMARDPAQRYASLDEMGRALEPFSGGMRFEMTHGQRSLPAGPTPSSGTQRLETPLSTESRALSEEVILPTRTRPLLYVLVAAVAIGVLAMGGVVVALMRKQTPIAADGNKPPATAAAASGNQAGTSAPVVPNVLAPAATTPPSQPDVTTPPTTDADGMPHVRTVRIGPEPPAAERKWEPPAGAAAKPPEEAVRPAQPPSADTHRADRDTKRADKDTHRSGSSHKREPPPAPGATPSTATTPPASGSVGRLGVQMKPDEF
jgi:serine/threonine-protein kinase